MARDRLPATYSVQKLKLIRWTGCGVAVGQGVMGVHVLGVACWRQTPVMQGGQRLPGPHPASPRDMGATPLPAPPRCGSAPVPGSSRVCPSKCCHSRCLSARTRDPKPQASPAHRSCPPRTRNLPPVHPPEVGDGRVLTPSLCARGRGPVSEVLGLFPMVCKGKP